MATIQSVDENQNFRHRAVEFGGNLAIHIQRLQHLGQIGIFHQRYVVFARRGHDFFGHLAPPFGQQARRIILAVVVAYGGGFLYFGLIFSSLLHIFYFSIRLSNPTKPSCLDIDSARVYPPPLFTHERLDLLRRNVGGDRHLVEILNQLGSDLFKVVVHGLLGQGIVKVEVE